MAHSPSTTDVLRQQTSSQHEVLDQLPIMKALMSPDLQLEQYREILSRMRSCFEVAESAIATQLPASKIADWHYRSKLPVLDQDQAALQASPAPHHSLTLSSPEEAQGAIYVLMGSSLGGRFIAKHVRRVLSLDENSGAAFYSSSEGDLNHWTLFKNQLNATHSGNSAAIDAVVNGARKCFTLFTKSFE